MTDGDYPWEPPLAGTEAEQLTGALDRLRTTFRWKADGLGSAGLQARIGASALTLGGLLKHLARVEHEIFTLKLTGEPIGVPWDGIGWGGADDPEFASAADDTPEQLYARGMTPSRAPLSTGDGPDSRRSRAARPYGRTRRSPCQPPAAALRPDRGVRPPHRSRRSAARGGGRKGR